MRIEIKKIKVRGKNFLIVFLINQTPTLANKMLEWYCAYVYLDNPKLENLDNCTLHNVNTYGVDTIHYFNDGQTLAEKKKDAERQIKELIKSSFKH